MQKITTCLWFDNKAFEAAEFYVKVFSEGGHDSEIGEITYYGDAGAEASGQLKGSVMTVEFNLDGNDFMALNGGSAFKFNPATSFIINCENQEEVDYFWEKLTEGGQEGQCGWIDSDKFGVSWQVVLVMLSEILSDPDTEKSERAMKAMLSMKKINIAEIESARNEEWEG